MTEPTNPYVTSKPVGNSPPFVGRLDILQDVVRALRRTKPGTVLLHGQPRIGKTSILQRMLTWLPQQGPFCPVYFDLRGKADWPLMRILEALAKAIAQTSGLVAPHFGQDRQAFKDSWLPSVLRELGGRCLVLMFDDFDSVSDPGRRTAHPFLDYARDLLTLDRAHLAYIIVLGCNIHNLDAMTLSMLRTATRQPVSLLSRDEARDLITLSQRNGTLRWEQTAVERVWRLTCGHPYLTQLLCSEVWRQVRAGARMTSPLASAGDVNAAAGSAMSKSEDLFNRLWEGLSPAARVVASALAHAGPEPISEEAIESLVRWAARPFVGRELQDALGILRKGDVVETVHGSFRFRVEFLRQLTVEMRPLRPVPALPNRIESIADERQRTEPAPEMDPYRAEAPVALAPIMAACDAERMVRREALRAQLARLEWLQSEREYGRAIDLAQSLSLVFPFWHDWDSELSRLQRKACLARLLSRSASRGSPSR